MANRHADDRNVECRRALPGTPERDVQMADDTLIAVFADHAAAERAVRALADTSFDLKQISIVGQGYHTEENVLGFYNAGDRVKFWGRRGAFWGGLWGLFFGGVFLMVPVVGQVMVLGYLAATVISAIESAVVVGGLSALGAACSASASRATACCNTRWR